MKYFSLIVFVFFLSACVFTEVRETADPDFTNFRLGKLLIITPSYEFDEAFTEELKDVELKYVLMNTLFLPTRIYSSEERNEIIKKQDFDNYLTISVTDDEKSTHRGSRTETNYGTYNSAYGSHTTSSTSTVPTTTSIRDSNTIVKIFDAKTNRVMWIGNLSSKAIGILSMSNSSTANDMVEELVDTLIEKQHLKKQQN